ncbi:hypothetical protein QE422_001190 [Chryseobacterium sp. SORGH_AS 447]|nr:hypothetical protein [Chryseobacterium sp. SORGH_AS_0447]
MMKKIYSECTEQSLSVTYATIFWSYNISSIMDDYCNIKTSSVTSSLQDDRKAKDNKH